MAVMLSPSKVLLPLDCDNAEQALKLVRLLHPDVAGFKVGLELINAEGFDIFDDIRQVACANVPIFYDCKLHDIPNTVAGAVRAIARRGVWMFNVHAAGGTKMMRAAVRAAEDGARTVKPLVVAVTVLTSISEEIAQCELGLPGSLADRVVMLARLAQDAGCDGVVCSPQEAAAIRLACGPGFVLVVPGVRPAGADVNDQKRVLTPGDAVRQGADYLVVGRPITGAPDPAAAARAVNAETSAVLQ